MSEYRIISSDNHVFEPPDLWLSRMQGEWGERTPRIGRDEEGDWWFVDGKKVPGTGFGFGGAQAGRRFDDPSQLTAEDLFDNVRAGGYVPEEQVKDMATDGVDVSILYPTVGLQLFKQPDGELLSAIFHSYNDWLADFCSAAPDKLKGIAMLNVDDVGVAVKELQRCRKMGFIGAMITAYPPKGKTYDMPRYENLWAAARDLEVPLSLHAETQRFGSGFNDGSDLFPRGMPSLTNMDYIVRATLADIILGGVFERYPKLQIGSVEYEVAWAAHFIDRLDYNYTQRTTRNLGSRLKDEALPSDYFRRNVFLGFQEDGLGMRLRDVIGVTTLQWGSDYPHIESTFPRSRDILDDILADCTEEERALIAGGNAARVYNL